MKLLTSFLYTLFQLGVVIGSMCALVGLIIICAKFPALILLIPAGMVFGLAWQDNYKQRR